MSEAEDQRAEAKELDDGPLRPGRYRAAVRYFWSLMGQLSTDGVAEETLQEVVTEVHLACMMVDPTLDNESPRYDPEPGPPLLHQAAALLREFLADPSTEDLAERTRALLERADPVVNPRDAPDDAEEYVAEKETWEGPFDEEYVP